MRKRKELNPHVIIITLISVLVIMQAVTLFFTVNPPVTPVIQGMTAEQKAAVADNSILLDKVRKVTQIDESVEPVIAIVTDVEMLKQANPINAEVYKNAKNGDRVIGIGNRMIIFSEVSNSIVYDGNSPAQIQQERYNQELQQVLAQVTKLTTVPVSVVPQLATVTDPVLLQQTNQVLYEDVEVGDKVLIYQGRTIVYRPSTNEIIADTQK